MKKKRIINVLIVVILVVLLSVCIGLIFGTGTYSAAAEETSIEVPQDSANESEAPVFTEKTYRYAHSETEYALITLKSDAECTIEMFDEENTGSRKITTTYKQTGGELTVYYMGDVLGRFIINADNTLTEAEETPAPDPEFDLDAFLAWVQVCRPSGDRERVRQSSRSDKSGRFRKASDDLHRGERGATSRVRRLSRLYQRQERETEKAAQRSFREAGFTA